MKSRFVVSDIGKIAKRGVKAKATEIRLYITDKQPVMAVFTQSEKDFGGIVYEIQRGLKANASGGSVCLQIDPKELKKLVDFNGEIRCEYEGSGSTAAEWLCGGARVKTPITVFEESPIPALPGFENWHDMGTAEQVKSEIKSLLLQTAKDDVRPVLKGINLGYDYEERICEIAASNGYQAIVYNYLENSVPPAKKRGFTVSSWAYEYIANTAINRKSETVKIESTMGALAVQDTEFITLATPSLLEGSYINIEKFFEYYQKAELTVNKKEIKSILAAVAKGARKSEERRVLLKAEGGSLSVTTDTAEYNTACKGNGDFDFYCNAKYLLNMIEGCPLDEVTLCTSRPPEGEWSAAVYMHPLCGSVRVNALLLAVKRTARETA